MIAETHVCEPRREPVAWLLRYSRGTVRVTHIEADARASQSNCGCEVHPLYTDPPDAPALAAIERAAYERGVRDALEKFKSPVGFDRVARSRILALLTQEGR